MEMQRWTVDPWIPDDLITSSFFLILVGSYIVGLFPPCCSFFMIALHASLLIMAFLCPNSRDP
ncbi:hypothetical protein BJX65DRAFT_261677 [Aspergillus insuetus]